MKALSKKDEFSSSKIEELTDPELWKEVINGNKKAFESLYFRHYKDLYKYALKMSGNPGLVEDSIHDLFLKIWNRRKELQEVSGVKTYLWRSLRNGMLSKLRKKNRRLKILNTSKDEVKPTIKLNAEELIIERENYKQIIKELDNALSKLTPSHREVLYLKFYHGMTYDEIEEVMSINYQTARNYVYKALKFLKEILK
ncbi:MAG: sigma-70 family RNA polymerase sigma factor [Balneolaceae bacterium]|nr:sigma-70 family RNA polymerase sigma factor [Balneolaceae bacterium]